MSKVGAIILGVSALLAVVSGNSISSAISLAGAFIVLSIDELITVIKDKRFAIGDAIWHNFVVVNERIYPSFS